MYKGKSLLIGNTELATFKDIKNFLFHNTSSLNTDSKSIDLYLRKSSYIMEHSYLNEHLLFQTGAAMYPPIKSREQLLPLYRYGPSNGQYSHCYSITDIIQTELLLLELDFLHSLKYCMLYWTAIPSVGNLILESSYNKINVNKSHKYPIDHNYFINNIKDMPEDGMLFTKKCMASSSDADVNSNSSLRRNLSEFFKNNETVLQYLGLHKTATSYRLPFTELYSFYSLFAFKRNLLSTSDIAEYNMQIVEDLKKQKYKRRKPEWFLYSYRINHLFLIQKLKTINEYFKELTQDSFISKFKVASPHIENPKKLITDLFFDQTFIDKFLYSDWPDCYIFVKLQLYTSICLNNNPRYSDKQYKEFRDILLTNMEQSFSCYLTNFAIDRLRHRLRNNSYEIELTESTIMALLESNDFFCNYYFNLNLQNLDSSLSPSIIKSIGLNII